LKSRPPVLAQSRRRHMVDCLADDTSRLCKPDEIMQRSGVTEVRILVENLYKLKGSAELKVNS